MAVLPELARPRALLLARIALVALVLLHAVVLTRNAWLCDDAYITYRTVDNFVHGHGLRWNVDERVQVFTHPLWMALNALVYAVTREPYYTFIAIALATSLAALALLVRGLARSTSAAFAAVAILSSSKAYVDYSTSGLENPLTHLLLVLFLFPYLHGERGARRLFWLACCAWLGALNRSDAFLLFAPGLLHAWWESRGWRSTGLVLLAALPFAAWELFSLVYYGSLVPNTAYAKLNTGLPLAELVPQGLRYLQRSLETDFVTLPFVAAGLIVALRHAGARTRAAAAGVILYLVYVLSIGGCFMLGRYLTAPLLVATVVLGSKLAARGALGRIPAGAVVAGLALVLGLISPRSPLRTTSDYAYAEDIADTSLHGIYDERGVYYSGTGLLTAGRGVEMPSYPTAVAGRAWRAELEAAGRDEVGAFEMVGMSAFFAGPRVHMVDPLALTDPLLARLLPYRKERWLIGHFDRRIPAGYLETLAAGRIQLEDTDLARFYEHLSLILRGELFDRERLLTILRMNGGAYDHLVHQERYLDPPL